MSLIRYKRGISGQQINQRIEMQCNIIEMIV